MILLSLPGIGFYSCFSKTRWSSTHSIPDADLLSGGKLLIDAHGYLYSDIQKGYTTKPSALLTIGIIEWINLETGYTGGPTFGLKARLLGETKGFLPSMAVGVHNVFSHKDCHSFGLEPDSLGNEIYIAIAKSVENLKLRFHLGVQSMPQNENEKVNPFFALEKYFGNGLYVSIEVLGRSKSYCASMFGSYRFLKKKVEISAGLVDIAKLIDKSDGKTTLQFKGSDEDYITRPAIFFGLRFLTGVRTGKSDGFASIEDKITSQNNSIMLLQNELDSLKSLLTKSTTKINTIDLSLKSLTDSSENNHTQLKNIISQKLISIKTLYQEEPFEPENLKKVIQETVSYRDKIIPVLSEIALDRKEDSQIRVCAVSIMGEIGSRSAADALIEVLAQTQLPEMKIEALIGLGKIKETRAQFLMQQLANDPHDGVAFTATEVLRKLEKETGIKLAAQIKPVAEKSIAENKIQTNHVQTFPVQLQTQTDSILKNDSLSPMITTVSSPQVEVLDIENKAVTRLDSIPAPTLDELKPASKSLPSDSTLNKMNSSVQDTISTSPVKNAKKERDKKININREW